MRKVTNLRSLRRIIADWRTGAARIVLVPTMGALHAGHLSLVQAAAKHGDKCVVSIFVNPTQFGEGEDLSRYPRDEAGDLKQLRTLDVDAVWMPPVDVVYPDGFATEVVPKGAALDMEGAHRPHHFTGVATVCCKLFNQVTPDVAIFGEKDFQQLAVLRQLVRDLNINVKIVPGKTVREASGLALSSRNRYLNERERSIAPELYATLKGAAKAAKAGARPSTVEANAKRKLASAGFGPIDYVAVRDATTLGRYVAGKSTAGRVLAAAWLGKTRLIDNCRI